MTHLLPFANSQMTEPPCNGIPQLSSFEPSKSLNVTPDSFSEPLSLRSLVATTRSDLEKCTDSEMIALQLIQFQETAQPSPFQKLPTEILTLIFGLATAMKRMMIYLDWIHDEGKIHHFRYSGEIFPLTWVCSEWRQIILSSPSFWTSYAIRESFVHSSKIELFNPKLSNPMINCLNELLLRSGTAAPLCLRLTFHGLMDRTYPVLNALIQHTSRWKEVTLEFEDSVRSSFQYRSTSQYIHGFPNLDQITSFPNLELLHISSSRRYRFRLESLEEVFGDCPRLRHLKITSFHSIEPFDLQHLTTLKIESVYIGASFALLLQRCPVLETFSLLRSKSDPVPDSPGMVPIPSIVHHPHLKNLSVHLTSEFSLTFWRSVSVPNLITVSAKIFATKAVNSRFDGVKQMLVGSQCVLERLHLLLYSNHRGKSVESFVEGIRLSSQTHTHCHTSMKSNPPYLTFDAVPSYEKPCRYCETGEGILLGIKSGD